MLGRLKALLSQSSPVINPATYRATMSTCAFLQVLPQTLISYDSTASSQPQIATFASGCFWGVQHIFLKHFPPSENKGILNTAVGYTGGRDETAAPSYEDVCSGITQHAEAVRIEFDPAIVSYDELVGMLPGLHSGNCYSVNVQLEFFYRTHDPTTSNRQGNDRGSRMWPF